MTQTAPGAARAFTGRHMLLTLVAFFGVVVAVNLLMAVMAGRSWTGLAVKSAYVASQHYNEVLDEARRQHERGWAASLGLHAGTPVVSLRDRNGSPVSGLVLAARFERATHEGADVSLDLSERGAGVYVADRPLAAGLWLARVESRAQGQDFRQEFRLVVKKEP
jgi:nitrogen fixation protein FixH